MQHRRSKTPLFQPFRHKLFRNLCIANFISNIGGWMQIFATGWLLAKQSSEPGVAALAQTATQAPIFLFALFGGVIADRMDQSKYLLLVNVQMVIAAALLGMLAITATQSAIVIIALTLTFILGTGAAFKVSAWQASMSSLVDPSEIEAAATLNGLSYNLASIIGPIMGGWLFTLSGPAALYFANALSFVGLIVLYWRAPKQTMPLSAATTKEPFLTALEAGVKHSFRSPAFRQTLGLTFILFFGISIFQSLLPIYVKTVLAAQETTLGWLMAAFGGGAVFAAFVLPSLRYQLHRTLLLSTAAAIYGTALLCFGYSNWIYFLALVAFVTGFSWASLVSTMNSGAQAVFSTDMRARALAIYSVVFAGALTLGSVVWGKIAATFGITFAYKAAGFVMLASALGIFALYLMAVSRMPSSPPTEPSPH